MPRVLIAEPQDFSQAALDVLRAGGDVELADVPVGRLGAEMAGYDAVWVRLKHVLDAAVISQHARCRAIACPVTGLDHIDLDACAREGVRVVSLKGEVEFLKEVRATAELTVALALAVMRQLMPAAASVLDGKWNRDAFRGHELYRKTVGLVGVGRLGGIVAATFRAFGMRVLGFDRRPDLPEGVERVESLEALAAQSDLVSVHVSYDASTRGLLGASFFTALKKGAYLVNTSRGGVVDEAAMLHALEAKVLAGAGLDVLSGEPLVNASHPVVEYAKTHANMVLVPHIGGNTIESFEKTEVFVAHKLLEVLAR